MLAHSLLSMESNSIPEFYKQAQALNDILEKACAHEGKWKKSALQHISLHKLSWGIEHNASLATIQDILRDAVKLAFPRGNHIRCVFAEA